MAPPPSTTSPPTLPTRPTSSWWARAPARSPRRCTAVSCRIGFPTSGSPCSPTDQAHTPTFPASTRSSPPGVSVPSPTVARQRQLNRRAVELSGPVHPERAARPRDRLRPPRLRLRRDTAAAVLDRRHSRDRSPVADRRQRDPDRGRRREPVQLHRAWRRAHRPQRRNLLHRGGQRPTTRGLGHPADRGRTGRRRALHRLRTELINILV